MTVAGMAGIITKARGGMLVFLGWGGGNWGLKWLRESVVASQLPIHRGGV